MITDLPDAYLRKWESKPPYYLEEKAPKREEYPWDYLGEFRVTVTTSNSVSATGGTISIPLTGSFS